MTEKNEYYDSGYQDGYNKGYKEGLAFQEERIAALYSTISHLKELIEVLRDDKEELMTRTRSIYNGVY